MSQHADKYQTDKYHIIYDKIWKPYDPKNINHIHLANVINNNQSIVLIDDIIPSINNYCVLTGEKLPFTPKYPSICRTREVQLKSIEYPIGDTVLNYCKYNSNMVSLLLNMFNNLLKNYNIKSIFKSFPKQYNIDDKVNIELLISDTEKLLIKIDDFISKSFMIDSDIEFIDGSNLNLYILLKFILITPNAYFTLNNNCVIDNINTYDIDFYGESKKKFNDPKYLFHGSKIENWYSIITNGLKNYSKTKLMLNGAAHGEGIYLSNDINMSINYTYSLVSNYNVIGVFEIETVDYELYKKTNNIFVVPDPSKLQLIKIIVLQLKNKLNVNPMTEINEYYNKEIYIDKMNNLVLSSRISKKRLAREYQLIKDYDEYELILNPNNIYECKCKIFKNSFNKILQSQMTKLNIDNITLNIIFSTNYPIVPPFVHIEYPRFVLNNEFITSNGAICLELLTQNYWSSSIDLKMLILIIKLHLMDNNLIIKDSEKYNYNDAIQEFKQLSNIYYWNIYHLL